MQIVNRAKGFLASFNTTKAAGSIQLLNILTPLENVNGLNILHVSLIIDQEEIIFEFSLDELFERTQG